MDKAEAFDLLMAFVRGIADEGKRMDEDPEYIDYGFNADDFAHGVIEEAQDLIGKIESA